MGNILTIAIREIRSYFVSPLAYVAMFFFIFVSGFIFTLGILSGQGQADMRPLFGSMVFLTLLVAPVLTMGLIARETSSGSIELLMSKPVRDLEVMLGKYLGAFVVYLVMLLVSIEFPLMYEAWGNPDWGVIASGYIGLALCGLAFLAIGTFASSVTDNQIAAWLIGTVLLLFFWLVGFIGYGGSGLVPEIAKRLSIYESFTDFGQGIVDGKSLLYFLSMAVIFLFMAVRSLENRRTA
ncbi:MAG TPA: ABC transporter permease [Armatimonadetes bacterium]|nr:ABC transporter permease [Armatimonadota bacterium]